MIRFSRFKLTKKIWRPVKKRKTENLHLVKSNRISSGIKCSTHTFTNVVPPSIKSLNLELMLKLARLRAIGLKKKISYSLRPLQSTVANLGKE